jgi:hypothetical protein
MSRSIRFQTTGLPEVIEKERWLEKTLAPPMEFPSAAPIQAPPAPPPEPLPEYKPQIDFDLDSARGRLSEARDLSATQNLISGISRAGTTINAAASGRKADYGMSDSIAAEAQQAEPRAQADISLDRLYAAARQKADVEDPASPLNRRYQDAFLKASPSAAALEPMIRKLNATQLKEMMGIRDAEMDRDEKTRSAREGEQFHRNQLAETNRHNIQQERIGWTNATKVPTSIAASTSAQDGIGKRHAENNLTGYDKRLDKDRQMLSYLMQVDEMAPGLPRGILPKEVGISEWDKFKRKLPGNLGSQFTDPQKAALSSAVSMMNEGLRRANAGATLTPSEEAFYQKAFQESVMAPPEVQAAVIDMFRRTLRKKVTTIEAAYRGASVPEDMFRAFEERGGISSSHPIFRDPEPAAPAPTPAAAPPAAKPMPEGFIKVRYKADPSGKVYRIPKDKVDGTVEVVQ